MQVKYCKTTFPPKKKEKIAENIPTFILHGLWKPHLCGCSWEHVGGDIGASYLLIQSQECVPCLVSRPAL